MSFLQHIKELIEETTEAKIAAGLFAVALLLGFGLIISNLFSGSGSEPVRSSAPTEAAFEPVEPVERIGVTSSDAVKKTSLLEDALRTSQQEEITRSLKESLSIAFTELPPKPGQSFIERVMVNQRLLRNYLSIDIAETLKATTQKGVVYEQYVSQMREYGFQGTKDVEAIDTELALLESEFSYLEREKQVAEEAYKASLANYDGVRASRELKRFSNLQGKQAEVFSLSNSLEQVRANYVRLINITGRVLSFVEANKDAIIKDVRVVNFDGLSNDLIISEKEWLESLR